MRAVGDDQPEDGDDVLDIGPEGDAADLSAVDAPPCAAARTEREREHLATVRRRSCAVS